MTPLTAQEIERYCTEYLNPVTIHVGRKLGPEAADLTGGCLLDALRKYDKSRPSNSNLLAWLRYKTKNLVIEALRKQDGRKGGAKYAARSSQTTLEDFDALPDQTGPGDALEAEEMLLAALKKVRTSSQLQRWLIIGGLWSFSNQDIQDITDVSQDYIYKEAVDLRLLLTAH